MAHMTLEERRERAAQRKAIAERLASCQEETRVIVRSGRCPQCGAGLRNNLAITGWWQCEQYGSEGFRKDSSKPKCSWQGFTH